MTKDPSKDLAEEAKILGETINRALNPKATAPKESRQEAFAYFEDKLHEAVGDLQLAARNLEQARKSMVSAVDECRVHSLLPQPDNLKTLEGVVRDLAKMREMTEIISGALSTIKKAVPSDCPF